MCMDEKDPDLIADEFIAREKQSTRRRLIYTGLAIGLGGATSFALLATVMPTIGHATGMGISALFWLVGGGVLVRIGLRHK